MKKPAYGLNDAPRRWWSIIGQATLKPGGFPSRAGRYCCVAHSDVSPIGRCRASGRSGEANLLRRSQNTLETTNGAIEHLLDPVHGSISKDKTVCGVACLHVDDPSKTGAPEFYDKAIKYLHKHFQTGSEDKNDLLFVWQRTRRIHQEDLWYLPVDQSRYIDGRGRLHLTRPSRVRCHRRRRCTHYLGASSDRSTGFSLARSFRYALGFLKVLLAVHHRPSLI